MKFTSCAPMESKAQLLQTVQGKLERSLALDTLNFSIFSRLPGPLSDAGYRACNARWAVGVEMS